MLSQPARGPSLTGLEMLVLESTLYLGREWGWWERGWERIGLWVLAKIVGGGWGSLGPVFKLGQSLGRSLLGVKSYGRWLQQRAESWVGRGLGNEPTG